LALEFGIMILMSEQEHCEAFDAPVAAAGRLAWDSFTNNVTKPQQ
jgi:hypothetical protein